jgi:eukaryotic-like serine/threonine-protein kinase
MKYKLISKYLENGRKSYSHAKRLLETGLVRVTIVGILPGGNKCPFPQNRRKAPRRDSEMSQEELPKSQSAPLSAVQRLDEACDEFEAAWKAGLRPRIEAYLDRAPESEQDQWLRELLVLEIELRRAAGERPKLDEYQGRFPIDIDLITRLFTQVISTSHGTPGQESERRSEKQSSERLVDDLHATNPWIFANEPDHRAMAPDPLRRGESSPPLPEKIGRYQVRRRLGGGGFGDVFLAFDEVMDRQVAIKVPKPRLLATPHAKEEFLNETRSVARLQHEGIVRVFDFGEEDDGRCYIVYEYVEGESLKDRIGRGPIPHNEAAEIVSQVAEALHYAHLQGLIHRDIKPANILLDGQGKPRIADFGLAVHEENLHREKDRFAGTLPYMSPEQVRREGHRLDGRTDIYSLGVVFYQLLCGRLPFQAKTHEELEDQIVHREAKPLRQIKDSVPREMERICLKALSKIITERYTTAKDMADDLRQTIPKKVVEPLPRRAIGRPGLWTKTCSSASTART